MPVINIEGVGKVSLDDSFTTLSPDAQNAAIEEITRSSKGGASTASPTDTSSSPAASQGGPDYYTRLAQAESKGGTVTDNLHSNATGRYQFMPKTWAGMIKDHPELNLTPDGINDEAQQARAIKAFTDDNRNGLSKNIGRDPNDMEMYSAHRFGVGGASKLLTADDNTPVASLFSQDWIEANPDLAGKTVGQVKAINAKKIGQGTSAPAAPTGPKDTSYTSALAQGLVDPLNQIGATLNVLGAHGTGQALEDIKGPVNYDRASDKVYTKDGGLQLGYLPRAVVEQAGNLGGNLLARGAGAVAGGALGSLAGPEGTAAGGVAGAIAGPAALTAAQVFGQAAREHAQANGRDEPNSEDMAWAAADAGVQGLVSGALFKGVGTKASGLTGSALREAGINATNSTVDQAITTGDVDPSKVLNNTIVGTATGAAAGATRVPGNIKDGIQDRQANTKYAGNDEQLASDIRVKQMYDGRQSAVDQYGSGKSTVGADEVLKGVKVELQDNIKRLVDTLKSSGDLDTDGAKDVLGAVTQAGKHNYELGVNGENYGYFNTAVDRVKSLGIDADTKATLENAIRDLNTVTYNGMKKNKIGPLEQAAVKATPYASMGLSGAGVSFGGPIGMAAGLIGPALMKGAGRAADSVLGLQGPEVLRRADAAQRLATARGLQVQSTPDAIKTAMDTALTKANGRAAQAQAFRQAQEAAFKQSVQEHVDADIVPPGGGIYSLIHEQTGLKPQAVIKGLQMLKDAGKITQGQIDAFHDNPNSLKEGKQGLTVINHLNLLAHKGLINRDTPAPSAPAAAPAAPSGMNGTANIRNPLAYAAAAKGNQDRVTAAKSAVEADSRVPGDVKLVISRAIARVGTAASQTKANEIATKAATSIKDPVARAYAMAALQPLIDQIRHP